MKKIWDKLTWRIRLFFYRQNRKLWNTTGTQKFFVSTIKNKFISKTEEKEDMETFLCNLGSCKKLPWWSFINSFRKDLNQKRFFEQFKDPYTWNDWVGTQVNTPGYKERLKKTTDALRTTGNSQ